MATTYKWRSSVYGVLVFEDKIYMANGPRKFSELDDSTQKINALAIVSYESDAKAICDALACLRTVQLHANGLTWQEWLAKASAAIKVVDNIFEEELGE